MDGIEVLERHCSIEVLLYVRDHPECSKSECIRADITRSASRLVRISDLIEVGLIAQSQQDLIQSTLILTPLGENIAARLYEIDQILRPPTE